MPLTERQERGLELLLEGRTQKETADELGITKQAVHEWTRSPEFAGELSERRAERRQAVGSILDAAVLDAVRVLWQVLNDEAQPGSVRVRAACSLLDRAGVTAEMAIELRGRVDTGSSQLDATARGALESRLQQLIDRGNAPDGPEEAAHGE